MKKEYDTYEFETVDHWQGIEKIVRQLFMTSDTKVEREKRRRPCNEAVEKKVSDYDTGT